MNCQFVPVISSAVITSLLWGAWVMILKDKISHLEWIKDLYKDSYTKASTERDEYKDRLTDIKKYTKDA